jgi:hypothetical protein
VWHYAYFGGPLLAHRMEPIAVLEPVATTMPVALPATISVPCTAIGDEQCLTNVLYGF